MTRFCGSTAALLRTPSPEIEERGFIDYNYLLHTTFSKDLRITDPLWFTVIGCGLDFCAPEPCTHHREHTKTYRRDP